MTHQGQAVQTTLDAGALKSVAQEGGGVYVPAETKRADMAEVYRRLIRPRLNAGTTEGDAAAARATTVKALIPRFGWLAWPALLLLVIERLIAAWPARRGVSGPMLGAALLSLSLLPVAAVGQETEPDPRVAYNAAVAAHAAGDAEAAQRGFAEAALRGVGRVEARARYNLARAAHVRAIAAANPSEAPAGAPSDDQAPAGGQAPEADPLALLDEAVREYAAALGADPAFDDARANLEAAKTKNRRSRLQTIHRRSRSRKTPNPLKIRAIRRSPSRNLRIRKTANPLKATKASPPNRNKSKARVKAIRPTPRRDLKRPRPRTNPKAKPKTAPRTGRMAKTRSPRRPRPRGRRPRASPRLSAPTRR